LKAFFEAELLLNAHSERDEPKNTIEVAVESGLLFLIIAVLNLFWGPSNSCDLSFLGTILKIK
jgi:hypothetical protein